MPVYITLQLPAALKSRVRVVAAAAGVTPHAFMVEAIERLTALSERRQDFFGDALAAREEVAQDGLVYDGVEVLSYLKARLEQRRPPRPRKRKL